MSDKSCNVLVGLNAKFCMNAVGCIFINACCMVGVNVSKYEEKIPILCHNATCCRMFV